MQKNRGFTVLELALAITIIALVIGGILVGRNLITTSQMRAAISQIRQYNAAIAAFQNKYEGLPGDIKNATSYWAADPSCGSPLTNMDVTKTCNGNGDGKIGGYS